tara:strand:+ start:18800 stop:18949 length:150 start_codon:yes stop_codon:yes gene_type:complete
METKQGSSKSSMRDFDGALEASLYPYASLGVLTKALTDESVWTPIPARV